MHLSKLYWFAYFSGSRVEESLSQKFEKSDSSVPEDLFFDWASLKSLVVAHLHKSLIACTELQPKLSEKVIRGLGKLSISFLLSTLKNSWNHSVRQNNSRFFNY